MPHSPGCAAGGTHATKQESYTRIRFDGSTWSIWSRSGVRTDLEPVYVTPAGGALRWGRSRTVDTHDNKVTYRWECVEGDCYPASVAYGPFVVTLLREVRPDVLSFATGDPNGLGNTRYRLGTILMSRRDVPIRAYRLGYSTSAASLRSLLQEVQHYGTDVKLAGGVIVSGTSLPPQTFASRQGPSQRRRAAQCGRGTGPVLRSSQGRRLVVKGDA